MRILMTGDAVGGVLTYALELVEGLAEHDVEVVLALTGPPPSAEQRRRIAAAPLAGYGERGFDAAASELVTVAAILDEVAR